MPTVVPLIRTNYVPRYFSEGEFARCTPPCRMSDLHSELLYRLDLLRERVGEPIIITCAYRTIQYEHEHGRDGTSQHCIGLAVDVKCTNSALRQKIIKEASFLDFTGIGIASTFIHLDLRRGTPVCWLY